MEEVAPGSRVIVSLPGGEARATVVDARGEHLRCQFEDGRVAWVKKFKAHAVPSESDAAPSEPPPVDSVPMRSVASQPAVAGPSTASQVPKDGPAPWPWILLVYLGVVPFGCTLVGALVFSLPYYAWRKDFPIRARHYNRHVWIAFACGIGLWTSLIGLSFLAAKFDWFTTPAEVVTSNDQLLSVKRPKELHPLELSQHASVQMGSVSGDVVLLIASFSKSEVDPLLSTREYSDLARNEFKKSLSNVSEEVRPSVTNINGMEAVQSFIWGEDKGEKVTVLYTTLKGRLHYHHAIATSLSSKFATHQPMLEEVVGSIKEIESPELAP